MIESGIVKRVHDLMLENIKFECAIYQGSWRKKSQALKQNVRF